MCLSKKKKKNKKKTKTKTNQKTNKRTWTRDELGSLARAINMDTLFVKWCPDPIPPTYRCKQPNASACPVRMTASGVFWHFSKLVCAICATKEVSFITCAMRPSASPAAHRKMLSLLANASCTNELACARTVFSPNNDLFSAKFYED